MRFRKKVMPQEGDHRQKTVFLFWPKTLVVGQFRTAYGEKFEETRWLETATWKQRYDTNQENSLYWHDLFWIEDEE